MIIAMHKERDMLDRIIDGFLECVFMAMILVASVLGTIAVGG